MGVLVETLKVTVNLLHSFLNYLVDSVDPSRDGVDESNAAVGDGHSNGLVEDTFTGLAKVCEGLLCRGQ